MMPHIYQEGMKRIITHIMSYASKMQLDQKKKKEKTGNCEVLGN